MVIRSKIACLLAPDLAVQVETRRVGPGAPLLIAGPVQTGAVFAASPQARAAGVQIGMSLYHARQMLPEALALPPDEPAYLAAHGALEAALRALTPAVETVGMGEFLADVRGLVPPRRGEGEGREAGRREGGAWGRYRSDGACAGALVEAARAASGLSVQVGVAAGKFAAQQAARAAPPDGAAAIPPGGEARFLAPLPLETLPGLPGELLRRMRLLDLYTLGDLAALPRPAVLRQFGSQVAALYELARGNDPRPLDPDAPPLKIVRSLQLASPVGERRILLNVTGRLARQLSRALAGRGYHAEALQLALTCADGRGATVGGAVKPPTADEVRLSRMAGQLLGRLEVASPVVNLALSAYPLRPWHLGAHQLALAQAGIPEKQVRLEEALQTLVRRFGEAIVRVAALLGPPLPLRVRVSLNPRGEPARLWWGGHARTVLAVDEHWREERRWWDRPLRRDYFRLLLADGSMRNLFQDLTDGEWYLDRAWPLL